MKFKMFKSALLMTLLAVFMTHAAWAGNQYYAKLTVSFANGSSGRGLVYANNSDTENTSLYSSSSYTGGNATESSGGNVSVYAYAYPEFGYKFSSWSNSNTKESSASGEASTLPRYTYSLTAQKRTSILGGGTGENNAINYYAKATFSDVQSQIKDIYLCKGDKVTLYFYNSTKDDIWTSRVNGSFLKSGGITGAATFSASSFDRTKGYSITVEANRDVATDDPEDKLTVMDYAGNVYHYRVHVAAARVVYVGSNVTHVCNSVAANNQWSASSDKATVASVSPASATAGQSVTATITGVGVGTTTVHVSDYTNVKKTGALGAAYDLAVAVEKEVITHDESILLNPGASRQVSGISGVTAVSSTDPMTAFVSRDGDSVTITGGSPGTATVDVETATQIYRYTVDVSASAMNITLCVDDTVKFNYDMGDVQSAYAQYQVYGNSSKVSASVTVQGNANGQNRRSVCLTIKALQMTDEPLPVELQIKRLGGNFMPYEKINVTVLPARLYEVGTTGDYTCFASAFSSGTGNATWTDLSANPSGIVTASYSDGQSAQSAGVHFVAAASGTTVVTAKNVTGSNGNLKGVEYGLKVAVIEPHVVNLAKGDFVTIWYNNTTAKPWSLVLNGVTYGDGEKGNGHGFDATVKTGAYSSSASKQSYIEIEAKGEASESDLIVVTDGDNYYAYRMTCGPERVIKVGDSVGVTCRTVSTYDWRVQADEATVGYVSATCPPHDSGDAHGSTVTITGLEPTNGEYSYVNMHNEYYDAEEVNAQGAIYRLACKVVGGPIIQVHLSAGAFIWTATGYWVGTNATYTVTAGDWTIGELPTDKSQAGFKVYNQDSFTWGWHSDGSNGPAAKLEIRANPGATKGDYVVYTVWAGDEKVVTFLVNVTTTFENMIAVGQTAEGFLYGSTEPWVSQSSDPDVCETQPTIYQSLYSSKAVPKRAGDVIICCTNPVTKADYWGIILKPYEIHDREIVIAPNSEVNVELPTNVYDPPLVAPWGFVTEPSGKVNAELTVGTASDATNATVHLKAGSEEGPDTIVVRNTYYLETLKIFVADPSKEIIRIPGKVEIQVGSTTNLYPAGVTGAWTAQVEHSEFASLASHDGDETTPVAITGYKAGETIASVTIGNRIYVYTVEVTRLKGDLPQLVLWVVNGSLDKSPEGEQRFVQNLSGQVPEGKAVVVNGAVSDDNMIVDAMATMGGYAVMAKQEGSTWLTVLTDDSEYRQEVVVRLNHIDKQGVKLVVGRNGTCSTISESFYQIISFSNAANRVTVERLGNKLVIKPTGGIGSDEVFVECYQEGYPDFPVIVHYFIVVEQRQEDEIREFEDGYIAYRGVSDIYEDSGDLVMVFTNVNEDGRFSIPEGLTARIDMLAVGGGGAGGSVAGGLGTGGAGGGGAGGYNSITNKKFQSGTFTVAVGQGGRSFDSVIVGQSLAGGVGFDSYITNQFGYVFIIANGGGGGGAPGKSEYEGIPGGSGGGAAWNGSSAGRGGSGMDGQGFIGAMPAEFKCGGGGGGAGGNGGVDQSAGEGKRSSISGTDTLYSVGGTGGRHDVVAFGQPGSGYGFGGGGGSNATGGDGADGIVVLRMSRLFKNILVPIPTTNDFLATLRTEWTNGVDVVPFPYEERQFRSSTDMELRYWTEAIDHITGTNLVHCAWGGEGGTNKVGVGYYSLNVYLKDGYAWDDGTQYGSTEYMRFNWVVTEDINNVDARVEVSKTIIWEDDSPNAIVRVNTSASPEMSGQKTPKVLFIGTLCNGHGLKSSVIRDSINTITENADISYFLYGSDTGVTDMSGSLKKGEKLPNSWSVKLDAPEHAALNKFYNCLYEQLSGTAVYDYIVFEFDGSRMADAYTKQNSHESWVAEKLKVFYEEKRVIQVVDNCYTDSAGVGKEIWGGDDYWRMNSYYNRGRGFDSNMTLVQYLGMVGLYCPSNYLANAKSIDEISTESKTISSGWSTITYYANPKYDQQANYSDLSALLTLLKSVIKVKPFDIAFKDKVMSPASGLTITGVTVNGCAKSDPDDPKKPSEDPDDWMPIIEWTPTDLATATPDGFYGTAVTYPENFKTLGFSAAVMNVTTNNEVKIDISNCTAQVWTRFDTHVYDDGTFCTSENAEYNQQTGKFEKNPNDGPANVGVIMGGGGQGMDIDGDAETAIPWRYTAYEIRGHVYENKGGDIFVGGTRYTSLSYPEGRNVTVYYRAWGGYRLTALREDTTDHNSADELEEYATSWTFENINKEHDVYVTFTPYFGTTESEPISFEYDGRVHVYPVSLVGWENIYDTEIRYSTDPDADDDGEWLNAEDFAANYGDDRTQTGVGDHMYWYRVFAYQPGYGTNFNEKGWVWVDTGVRGSNVVTITKAPLVITANSFKLDYVGTSPEKETDGLTINYGDSLWRGVTVSGLYDGDEVVTNGTIKICCPTYEQQVGQYMLLPTYADGKTSADIDPLGNYTIEFRPGGLSIEKSPMVIGGVSQFGNLDADDPLVNTGVPRVEKSYDGKATNIVVRVDKPTGVGEGEDFHIRYSTDGVSWSDVNPQFEHAGTNKVWYSVTSGANYEDSNYFYVTNFSYVIVNPAEIELTSASATKSYDGTALTASGVELTAGELFGDDTFTFVTSGTQTDVGSSANAFTYELVSADANVNAAADYRVKKNEGTLTVTYASIKIGDVTHPATSDPTQALDYGKTGVEDVEVVYDGTGWNVEVNVGAPVSGAVVHYTMTPKDPASWSSTLAFTNVGEYVVYFAVDAPNYASVTNFAKVTIKPYPVTVTADDQYNVSGDPEPTYTVTVGQLALRDRGHEAELIAYPAPTCPTFPVDGETVGEYPIVFNAAETVSEQGNYVVTFVPGTLFIDETARVGSLWIVDHENCDDGSFYLAFKPTLNSGELKADDVVALAEARKIKVAYATDEESLKSVEPFAVELRDPTGELDIDKGWIWVKVSKPVSDDTPAKLLLWQVLIDR